MKRFEGSPSTSKFLSSFRLFISIIIIIIIIIVVVVVVVVVFAIVIRDFKIQQRDGNVNVA